MASVVLFVLFLLVKTGRFYEIKVDEAYIVECAAAKSSLLEVASSSVPGGN